MAVSCCQSQEIPRVSASALSPAQFHAEYFLRARPVIITDAAEDWPARSWTIPGLVDRVGDNEVWVRGKTNQEDYRVGKVVHTVLENIEIIQLSIYPFQTYTIRRDTFRSYCEDLQRGNARARSSYLAVASLQQTFPQLLAEVPLPAHLRDHGKLHLGPYLWLALRGHYEFCHFDPDDNFLVMIQGRE